ncbi:MAG: tRNA pseudouridine(38-40) synthase TruA [Bacteroidia bacterium]
MRYFLDISYKGTHYAGWQKQLNAANTVQQELESALGLTLGSETHCTGAGRTDTGVHAHQLMVHFDTEKTLDRSFIYSLNGILPYDIAVNRLLLPTDPALHARFNAISRKYIYRIVQKKSPMDWEFAMWVRYPLDLKSMNEASKILFDYNEFGAFCKSHAANQTNLCEIRQAYWEEKSPGELSFTIEADRFLRGMVRAIVGTLLWVGSGKRTITDFAAVIESQDRRNAGGAADAKGLSLVAVNYPEGSLTEIT